MSDESKARVFRVDYTKAASHRTVHIDGAKISLTPDGRGLTVILFSQVQAAPPSEEYAIDAAGYAGERIDKPSADVFIEREIQATAILDIDTAKALRRDLAMSIKSLTASRCAARTKGRK